MSNAGVTVDVSRVNAMFDELRITDNEAKRAVRNAIRESLRIIQREAKSNFKSVTTSSGAQVSQRLAEFIRVYSYKRIVGGAVNIMGDRSKRTSKRLAKSGKTNKSYVLNFLNQGTADRFIKRKNAYRGRIEPSNFFTKAVNSKQSEAERHLGEAIINHIQRVHDKRK